MTYPVTSNQRLECAALLLNGDRYGGRPVRLAREAYHASGADFAAVPVGGTWLEYAATALLEHGVTVGTKGLLTAGMVAEALGMSWAEFRWVHVESVALAGTGEGLSADHVWGANTAQALRKLMAIRK